MMIESSVCSTFQYFSVLDCSDFFYFLITLQRIFLGCVGAIALLKWLDHYNQCITVCYDEGSESVIVTHVLGIPTV